MSRDLAILEKLEKELSLKQLQIKSLLTITQAINDNVAAAGLFNMYKSFLSWEMGIDTMNLFIKNDSRWQSVCNINYERNNSEKLIEKILPFKRLHTVKPDETPGL